MTVAVTAPTAVGKVRRLTVRRDTVRARALGLTPGAVRPARR